MTVSDLQAALAHLGRFVDVVGGGAKPAAELAALAAGLERFKSLQVKALTELLGRLDESGQLAPKATRPPAAPKAAKAPKADPAAVAAEAKRLYDGAATATTEAEVVAFRAALDGLPAASMKAVAAAVEYRIPSGQKVGDTRDAIRDRIVSRMGSTIRRHLLDRPEVSPAGTP